MKKFIALLLAMLMALSLVACGGSDEGNAEQPALTNPKRPASSWASPTATMATLGAPSTWRIWKPTVRN